jgi:hypothetical protein
MDRHKIWRIVANNLRALDNAAPNGYVAVVDVFIVGRSKPVRLSRVETDRDPDFPWVFIADEVGSPTAEPDDHFILVPEQYIERIELRFVRPEERRAIGFSYGTIDDRESAR